MSKIPFMNLGRQLAAIKPEVMAAVEEVLDSQAFIQGPFVARFERAFCALLGAAHGVGCANGTAAIALALEAMGVGAGDEVITVGHTFAATAEAIRHVGAFPVFVDIEPAAYTMDMVAVAAAITPRTKAVIPVHIYGVPCDMDALASVLAGRDIRVIEDTAQAHLATNAGRACGTMGDAGTFSFYPGKNLGAYGDAGFLTVRDAGVAERARKLLDHGRASKYTHDLVGWNHRMDGIQGAILSVKLKYLPAWTEARRAAAQRYDDRLKPAGFKVIEPPAASRPVYHLYVVEVSNRDDVMARLAADGIAAGIHYPVPLHRQEAFLPFVPDGLSLPVTERVVDRIVSLPLCGDITGDEQARVLDSFLSVARP